MLMADQIKYFKGSKKSVCSGCFNFNNDCTSTHKLTGNDGEYSFVKSCASLNKSIETVYSKNVVSVSVAADSRIEMMGGGHK